MNRPPDPPRLFDRAVQGPDAAWLLLLTVLAAVTEGIGLIMLVPLIASLDSSILPQPLLSLQRLLPDTLGPLLAVFVILVALRAGLVLTRRNASERFQIATVERLRARLWSALLHCEWRELLTLRRSGSAATLIGDIDRIGVGLSHLLGLAGIAITLAGTGLAALVISPALTLAAGLAGGLVLVAYGGMRRRAMRLGQSFSEAAAAVYSSVDQGLSSLRVLKSLGQEDMAKLDTGREVALMRQSQLDFVADHGRGQALLQVGGAAAMAALVWFAADRLGLGASRILPMVALLARTVPLLGLLQETWLNWSHSRPALDATLALIARTEAACEDDARTCPPPALREAIRLRGVTIHYADQDEAALYRVSATIPACGITALVGPSGAGKSTLADVVDGLLAPDEGEVWIDSTPLTGPARIAWRGRVAYVQQDPVILAASLRDNLRWAAPAADDARIESALREAAADFVLAWPAGLDTRLGDGGRQLSGGERQRLMLARALLRDPALLILDEATSALDAASEARIAEAVAGLGRRMAVVVISHRGALLALADQTITLAAGRIVADSSQAGAL